MYHSKKKNAKIVSVRNNFHGIMSYGNKLTTRFFPIKPRLERFSNDSWPHFEKLSELEQLLSTDDSIAGVIVEPIQSTYGDNHLDYEFMRGIRELCTELEVPLIFDEIQTGFCATGKTWLFEHLDIVPDIVIFGKKAQVCGIMTTKEFSSVFESKYKMLDTTWDSDLVDMIRSRYVMDVIESENLRDLVSINSKKFLNDLEKINNIYNVRGKGCLIAFDFKTQNQRDKFYKDLYRDGMLCNPTGKKSIRLRPHLTVTEDEFKKAYKIIRGVL